MSPVSCQCHRDNSIFRIELDDIGDTGDTGDIDPRALWINRLFSKPPRKGVTRVTCVTVSSNSLSDKELPGDTGSKQVTPLISDSNSLSRIELDDFFYQFSLYLRVTPISSSTV